MTYKAHKRFLEKMKKINLKPTISKENYKQALKRAYRRKNSKSIIDCVLKILYSLIEKSCQGC